MTPDEALDMVSAEWGGVPGLPEVEACDVLRTELARLRAIESAARAIDEQGGDLPHLNDALADALNVTPGLPPEPPRG